MTAARDVNNTPVNGVPELDRTQAAPPAAGSIAAPRPRFWPPSGWPAIIAPIFVPRPPRMVRPRDIVVAVIAVGLGIVASLFRTPNVFNVVYIEDGQRFLADALVRSPLAEPFLPYSGYFQVVPRVLGQLAALFPVSQAAIVLAIEGAAVNSLLALLVYVASGSLLQRPLLRLLVSIPLILTPTAHLDVPNSITQLRWPFMYVMFWMLLWVPTSRLAKAIGAVVVVLIAASDNVVPIFLPLAIARFVVRRDKLSVIASVALAVNVVANGALVVTGVSRHPDIVLRLNPVWAAAEWAFRPVPEAFVGERWAGLPRAHTLLGLAPIALGWIVLAAAVVVAGRRMTRPNWLLASVAVVYSAILYMFVVMVSGITATRYTVPPTLLLLVAVAALLPPREAAPVARHARDVRGASRPRWRQTMPAAVMAAIVLMACLGDYRMSDNRSNGPRWSTEIAKARDRCTTQNLLNVDVPISPAEIDSTWIAVLPCRYVSGG
jgi:hypothetical protein